MTGESRQMEPAELLRSAPSEQLILVDEQDREVGYLDKDACHEAGGVLHRAFSVLIFDGQRQLLLQQRSRAKRLWPLYWSNSCCSHPRRGETLEAAVRRRLREELGLRCPVRFLFKFQYQAQYDAASGERELCSVFVGSSDGPVAANPEEIAAWRWVGRAQLELELERDAAGRTCFTPWFRLEWERIRRDHSREIFERTGARSWAYR